MGIYKTAYMDGKEFLMYKVLDLFSGCGGLGEGFLQAGFDVAASVEIDEKACSTQRQNHPDTQVLQADLTQLSPEELTKVTGIKQFDVIVGGPPCQGFSLIGTRLGTGKGFGAVSYTHLTLPTKLL